MALADTARLVASLELQDKFSRTAGTAERTLGSLERRTSTLGRIGSEASRGLGAAANNIKTLGVVAAGAIASQVALGVQSLAQLAEVKNQTDAVLESTKGVANVTADEVRAQAEALESLSTVDDKVIQAGQNMLLTFTNIRNEVGKGNDIFTQATDTLLDLSVALGTDPKDAAIQLGKALNDPIRGITALRRVGVAFTEQQEKQIEKMVEAGRTMDAQKVILRELNKEFSGSAEAFGEGPGATMRRFGDAVEEAQQALATGFLPLMEKVSDRVQEAFSDPAVIANIEKFGKGLAGGLDQLIDTASKLPWQAIGSSLQIAGTGAKAVLTAFTSLPPWIQTAVLTGWGLNKLTGGALGSIAGILGKQAFGAIRGATPATPVFTKEVGLGGAAVGAGGGLFGGGKGFLAGAAKVFGIALAGAFAVEVGKEIGNAIIGPQVQPQIDRETGIFEQQLEVSRDSVDRLAHMEEALEDGIHGIAGNTVDGLERFLIPGLATMEEQLAAVREAKEAAIANAQTAREQRDIERDALSAAKKDRLDASHNEQATIDALKALTLEQRLIRDKGFKAKIDSAEFLRILRKTSEFGAAGKGTSIEFGPKTGRDPLGDAFVALVKRLPKNQLTGEVYREVSNHIIALEEVQAGLIREGKVAAARHAQQNIDKLAALIGTVDRTRPALDRTADRTQQTAVNTAAFISKMENQLGVTREQTGIQRGILAKDTTPNVNVAVKSTTTVSVNDVVRAVNTYDYAVNTFGNKLKQIPL